MPREGACLVVTDLSLPDSEGLDLIHELLDLCPTAQILVFSMHDESSFGPRALEAGAHGYLTKGDNITELKEALACVLGGNVYASPLLAQLLMRRSVGRPHTGATVDKLTEREFQVFKLLGEAHSTKEIAFMLHLSPKTIESHRDKIKTKLGLASGGQLVIAARDFLNEGNHPS
jgi:DNA-binding NarL/FixJ family response regulator